MAKLKRASIPVGFTGPLLTGDHDDLDELAYMALPLDVLRKVRKSTKEFFLNGITQKDVQWFCANNKGPFQGKFRLIDRRLGELVKICNDSFNGKDWQRGYKAALFRIDLLLGELEGVSGKLMELAHQVRILNIVPADKRKDELIRALMNWVLFKEDGELFMNLCQKFEDAGISGDVCGPLLGALAKKIDVARMDLPDYLADLGEPIRSQYGKRGSIEIRELVAISAILGSAALLGFVVTKILNISIAGLSAPLIVALSVISLGLVGICWSGRQNKIVQPSGSYSYCRYLRRGKTIIRAY